MYHVIKSRAGRYGLVLTIIRQLEALDISPTAYTIAGPLDISPPTARKLLNEMESEGILASQKIPYRQSHKVVYTVLDSVMTSEQHALNSQALIIYHSGKVQK